MFVAPGSAPKLREVMALFALLLLGYWQVAGGYFQAEDFPILQNIYDAQGGINWGIIAEHFRSQQHIANFRPLVTVVHAVATALFGPEPAALRGLNLSAHLINALLVYLIVVRLAPTRSRLLPLFAAALFVTHPIHPEAVSYVVAVVGVACLTFYLTSILLFLEFMRKEQALYLLASLTAFSIALGFKEEAVSLPFAVGLIVVFRLQTTNIVSSIGWGARVTIPYFVVLLAYFGYRYAIFGSLTPSFFDHIDHGVVEFLTGLPNYLFYAGAPVNQHVLGTLGAPIASAFLYFMLSTALIFAVRNRPSVLGVAFCCLAFLVFLLPFYKVVPFGVFPNLLNSRYLYAPSIAVAGLMAWLAFGSTTRTSGSPANRLSVVLAITLVIANLVALNINNFAWKKAMQISADIREQAMALTGSDANTLITNLPDNVYGALFDRGSYYRSFLHPFTPGNFVHSRLRTLQVDNLGSSTLLAELIGDGSFSMDEHIGRIHPGESAGLPLRFDPEASGGHKATVRISATGCAITLADIPVHGRGINNTEFRHRTYLAASISAPLTATSQDSERRLVSVSDAQDGVPAGSVGIFIPSGAPSQMTYWTQLSESEWSGPNTPVTIADGASQAFAVDFTHGSATTALVDVQIRGVNTPPAEGNLTVSVGDGPTSNAKRYIHHPLTSERDRTPLPEDIDRECGHVRVFPGSIDFGNVPTEAFAPRAHEQLHPIGSGPALFWDSEHEQLVPASRVDDAPVVLDMLARMTPEWAQRHEIDIVQVSPPLVRFTAPSFVPRVMIFDDIDFDSDAAAYFLFTLKFSNSPNPYVRLYWQGEGPEPFTGNIEASLPAVPDGQWRTYAVALHQLPAWRGQGDVRRLQLIVGGVRAKVELARLQLIGSVSQRAASQLPKSQVLER